MSRRVIFCEGPDDLNALRAIAQCLDWAKPVRSGPGAGAGQQRKIELDAGGERVEIIVPSKSRDATGEGKSALARAVATTLIGLPPQAGERDEDRVSVVAAVFDPDEGQPGDFHAELLRALRDHADTWTVADASAPGMWRATRDAGEWVDVRAVHWRATGEPLDGLPDHSNLDRLLCAVAAKAYPDDVAHAARWLGEINQRRHDMRRKPATWKAAVHVWLAAVYDKADELNAASRLLHQQPECRPHVEGLLAAVGLVDALRPLLGPLLP